jgi:hypothetical protein
LDGWILVQPASDTASPTIGRLIRLRRRYDANVPLAPGTGGRLDDDLDIAAEESEEVHQPFGGEAGELAAKQSRDLRLIDLEQIRRPDLSEPAGANGFGDPQRQFSLR